MLQRTNLIALATLGLGTLLGYAAAQGKLPWASASHAQTAEQTRITQVAQARSTAAPATALANPKSPIVALGAEPKPGNPRGATTGPTDAPGYDHPNQFLHVEPKKIAENMEPIIVHPKQMNEAMAKLAKAKTKNGKAPNFLVFLLDDVGWMDPGFNGGGETVGNPTPNMDRVARKSLVLRSAYSTPSCSPSRASIMTGQNPLHHGILRPPMYNEPGGLDGIVTLAAILQQTRLLHPGHRQVAHG